MGNGIIPGAFRLFSNLSELSREKQVQKDVYQDEVNKTLMNLYKWSYEQERQEDRDRTSKLSFTYGIQANRLKKLSEDITYADTRSSNEKLSPEERTHWYNESRRLKFDADELGDKLGRFEEIFDNMQQEEQQGGEQQIPQEETQKKIEPGAQPLEPSLNGLPQQPELKRLERQPERTTGDLKEQSTGLISRLEGIIARLEGKQTTTQPVPKGTTTVEAGQKPIEQAQPKVPQSYTDMIMDVWKPKKVEAGQAPATQPPAESSPEGTTAVERALPEEEEQPRHPMEYTIGKENWENKKKAMIEELERKDETVEGVRNSKAEIIPKLMEEIKKIGEKKKSMLKYPISGTFTNWYRGIVPRDENKIRIKIKAKEIELKKRINELLEWEKLASEYNIGSHPITDNLEDISGESVLAQEYGNLIRKSLQ